MNQETIRQTLQRVFAEVFEGESFSFNDSLSRETLPSWDSLGHIRLVTATEEAFDVRFTLQEIEELKSVAQFVAALQTRF